MPDEVKCTCSWAAVFAVAPGAALTGMKHDRSCATIPGRWRRATLKTSWGLYEVRERPDGDYDVREIERHGGRPAMRKIPAGRIRAEFVISDNRRLRRR